MIVATPTAERLAPLVYVAVSLKSSAFSKVLSLVIATRTYSDTAALLAPGTVKPAV